jgi:SET and RING associated domain
MYQFELDYISRLFKKTSSKPTELYVLSRIWHQLDDTEIQMVPQQYVGLKDNRYAMTDIFFPQIRLFVEINEPAHYQSDLKIVLDHNRQQQIESLTGIEVKVIDCRPPLKEIHQQIDDWVELIKRKVSDLRIQGIFRAWRPNESRNFEYWRSKGIIRSEDDVVLPNIESICALFEANFQKTKAGFLRKGAVIHPTLPNYVIWWPSADPRRDWYNHSLEDGDLMTESHRDLKKNKSHYYGTIKWPHKRIIFYFTRDVLGFLGYRFMGVYEIDFEKSNEQEGLFWKRVNKEFRIGIDI